MPRRAAATESSWSVTVTTAAVLPGATLTMSTGHSSARSKVTTSHSAATAFGMLRTNSVLVSSTDPSCLDGRTLRTLPPHVVPSIAAIARLPSSSVPYNTKPKPRLCAVFALYMMMARLTSPKGANMERRAASSASWGSPATRMLKPPPLDEVGVSSSATPPSVLGVAIAGVKDSRPPKNNVFRKAPRDRGAASKQGSVKKNKKPHTGQQTQKPSWPANDVQAGVRADRLLTDLRRGLQAGKSRRSQDGRDVPSLSNVDVVVAGGRS
mmetsp:Transcript_48452/g.149557  ORF Transcript_48452/g.149557 Transcript_48452/m.149557 type:complete len:267 (-) Transcript_48452:269-1069(-)